MNELLLLWYLAEAMGEIERLRQGLVESIQSEDDNRYMRWGAERKQVQAEADRREAMQLALALWQTCIIPGRALDVLRMKRQVQQAQDTLAETQRLLDRERAKTEMLLLDSPEEWEKDED